MQRRVWDAVVGAAAGLLTFAAVPACLLAFVGLPLPQRWTVGAVVSWHGLFDLLATVAWCAWAACAWPLLSSVVRRVRCGDTSARSGARITDRLALRIAAGVLAISPVAAASATSGAAAVTRPAATAQARPARQGAPGSTARPGAERSAGGATAAQERRGARPTTPNWPYTVAPGDTLWGIAEVYYGDGADWQAIAAANLGRTMGDGLRFVDPALIQPGWVLRMPALASPTASLDAAAPDRPTADAATSTPGLPPSAAPGSAPAPVAAAVAAAVPTPAPAPDRGAGIGRVVPRPPAVRRRTAGRRAAGTRPTPSDGAGTTRSQRHAPDVPPPIPELAVVGCGVLVGALIARRARRQRRLAAFVRAERAATPVPTDGAAGLGAALDGLERAPVLEWLEVAARHLGLALTTPERPADLPAAQLVRVGSDGVEVRLAGPSTWCPPGWTAPTAASWLLLASADLAALRDEARDHAPWSPLLVPLGDNADGTWLLALRAGTCLPVLGVTAGSLVRAMCATMECWTWQDGILATTDPALVAQSTPGAPPSDGARGTVPGAPADEPAGVSVLFFGDPASLTAAQRERCAVVTTQPVAGDLTVVVDATAASVHPLGVTVRPHRLDADGEGAAGELLGGARPAEPGRGVAGEDPPATVGRHPALLDVRGRGAATKSLHDRRVEHPAHGGPRRVDVSGELVAGRAEVRVLTAVPRIGGLSATLPPKLARRSVELVAYLALHRPQPVTGDRLRTRVLGSGDNDAAAKTLFNVAGAARRSLGRDPSGEPLFPPATRAGHYRLSPLVTVDAARLAGLVGAGMAAADPEEAMALLREGLGLVESEPLSGVLTGYGWWRAEGHERRIADAAVDGGCHLVRLAIGAGHVDLARWAIEQARKAEPYSEALTRAAMELAAATGDARRLHLEWLECLRQVDELDPGGVPSDVTERLYVRLRQEVSRGNGASLRA